MKIQIRNKARLLKGTIVSILLISILSLAFVLSEEDALQNDLLCGLKSTVSS